jgi:hypothetical protein
MSRATLSRRLTRLAMARAAEVEHVPDSRKILLEKLLSGMPGTGQGFPTYSEAELAAMSPLHRKLLAPFKG